MERSGNDQPGSLITALVPPPGELLISGSGAFDMAATAFALRSNTSEHLGAHLRLEAATGACQHHIWCKP
jgi:hypothetical protein